MNKDWQLFKVYLMAGTFTFSGGMAMLPVIERELCQKRQLLPRDELYEYTTLSQTFPGVIALTNACFVGEKVNGKSGMLAAGLGAILPAFVLMLAATHRLSTRPAKWRVSKHHERDSGSFGGVPVFGGVRFGPL